LSDKHSPASATPLIKDAAPFLKWAGGKSQLLAQYAPLFPAERPARYFEPFVGSGAVFFQLRGQDFTGEYHLSDVNKELIAVYQAVRDDVDALIDLLADHKAQHTADADSYFYAVRARDRDPAWLESVTGVERAARMIYLNKTCFNGLWRVNSKGQFNAPLGRYTNPAILDERKLRAASAALQGVQVAVRDFRAVVDRAQAGDFVYFDPPYVPLSDTANFTSYAKSDFGKAEQEALADVFRQLDAKNVRVMLSNSDAQLVYDLYTGFKIDLVQARRMINSQASKRGAINEVVVRNYTA
jgi:DNA adenine methylase